VNSDDVLHNVFSPISVRKKFNLGSWPKGQSKSYTFKEPGCSSTLLCNVHPEMEGHVVVRRDAILRRQREGRELHDKGRAGGKYALKIWHEKLKGQDVAGRSS